MDYMITNNSGGGIGGNYVVKQTPAGSSKITVYGGCNSSFCSNRNTFLGHSNNEIPKPVNQLKKIMHIRKDMHLLREE
jgi:hypothetical protein